MLTEPAAIMILSDDQDHLRDSFESGAHFLEIPYHLLAYHPPRLNICKSNKIYTRSI